MVSIEKIFYCLLALSIAVTQERLHASLVVLQKAELSGINISQFLIPLMTLLALLPIFDVQKVFLRLISALASTTHYLIIEGTAHASHERFIWLLLSWGFLFIKHQESVIDIFKRYLIFSYSVSGIWKYISLFRRFDLDLPHFGIGNILQEQIAQNFLFGYQAHLDLIPLLQRQMSLSAALWILLILFELFAAPLYWHFYSRKPAGLIFIFFTFHLLAQLFVGVLYFWQLVAIAIIFSGPTVLSEKSAEIKSKSCVV